MKKEFPDQTGTGKLFLIYQHDKRQNNIFVLERILPQGNLTST